MIFKPENFKKGFSQIELLVAMGICTIPIFTVGTLLISGNRGWEDAYNYTFNNVKQEALSTTLTFGSLGRKSNKMDYQIYTITSGNIYVPAVPLNGTNTAYGQAVEFRYWAVPFSPSNTTPLTDVDNTGTHYAFFYIYDMKLKVDYGTVDQDTGIAAIDENGYRTTDRLTKTMILTNDIDITTNPEIFTHSIIGSGQGCVRMNLVINDPNDFSGDVELRTATLMRNVWPQ